MAGPASFGLRKRFTGVGIALCTIVLTGTVGYWLISGMRHSLFDCLYMSVITITTVGFGEIIELGAGGRILTILIALCGIGTMTYLFSSLTAFVVEGELTETFRRKTMEKKAKNLENHYIVCGAGQVGVHIVDELLATQRPCVVIDLNRANLAEIAARFENIIYFDADATDDDTLLTAGITRARGVFAATDDDNQNLVIALTAKQLNPQVTVIARCGELKNVPKIKAAGADGVIAPCFIGGLRMASEMIRPTVVSFLDTMLRDKEKNLRIEEIPVCWAGHRITELRLQDFPNTLLLAVRTGSGWHYNPPRDHVLEADSRLIVMTTPQERTRLEEHLQNRPLPPPHLPGQLQRAPHRPEAAGPGSETQRAETPG